MPAVDALNYSLAATAEVHFSGLYAAIDSVAREAKFLAFLKAPPREESWRFFKNIVDNDLCQLVALQGEAVVGWCDILPVIGETRAHIGVLGIGLLPHARHQGLGAKLLEATLARAWQKGFTRIELSVREDNLNAKALYERYGFVNEGMRRRASLVQGEYRDMYAMALLR